MVSDIASFSGPVRGLLNVWNDMKTLDCSLKWFFLEENSIEIE